MTKEEFTKMKQELEAYVDLITTLLIYLYSKTFNAVCCPVFPVSL